MEELPPTCYGSSMSSKYVNVSLRTTEDLILLLWQEPFHIPFIVEILTWMQEPFSQKEIGAGSSILIFRLKAKTPQIEEFRENIGAFVRVYVGS